MYVSAVRPTPVSPCVDVFRTTSLLKSLFPIRQCPESFIHIDRLEENGRSEAFLWGAAPRVYSKLRIAF